MFEDYLDFDVEPFKEKIKKKVYEMYEDDLGSGDITTEAVIKSMNIRAIIKVKNDGKVTGWLRRPTLYPVELRARH